MTVYIVLNVSGLNLNSVVCIVNHALRLYFTTPTWFKYEQPWNSVANLTNILAKSGKFPTPDSKKNVIFQMQLA